MIEGYNDDGRRVLLNTREVVEVYAGGTEGYDFWCNVKTTSGVLHRFKGPGAERVYHALAKAEVREGRASPSAALPGDR
jgi:hypothetical protein